MEESFLLSYLTAQCGLPLCMMSMINLKNETGNKYFMHQKTEDTSLPLEKCQNLTLAEQDWRRPAASMERQQRHSPEAEAELHGRQEHFLRLKRDRATLETKATTEACCCC